MIYFVIIVDVLAALLVLVLVLLHSGKGGGLSDMFGGGLSGASAGSTVVERNLDRITIVVSLVFVFSTLALALMLDK